MFWGAFQPLGGSRDPIHVDDDSDRDYLISYEKEFKYTEKFIKLLEEIWEEAHGNDR